MQITKTFKPIRPIYAEDDGRAYYLNPILGVDMGRVHYGHWHWPSCSYWLVPGTFAID
jgi:hypothetical protein